MLSSDSGRIVPSHANIRRSTAFQYTYTRKVTVAHGPGRTRARTHPTEASERWKTEQSAAREGRQRRAYFAHTATRCGRANHDAVDSRRALHTIRKKLKL